MSKRSFTSLDVHSTLDELKERKGARVQKVYQKSDRVFLTLYKKKKEMLILRPRGIYFTQYTQDFPTKPPNFSMLLRKRLLNSTLESAEQHHFDRVITLTFKGKETFKLVVELFSDGNLILLDSNDTIIQPLRFQEWKHRSIKPKKKYVFPPESFNTPKLAQKKFSEILKSSEKDLVRTLATTLSLGGEYAEELCTRAEVKKNTPPSQLKPTDLKNLHTTLKSLFKSKEFFLYRKKSKPIDFSVIKLSKYKAAEPHETLSSAADEYFSEIDKELVEEKHEEIVKKLEKIIETQRKTLLETRENMKEWKIEADTLSAEQKFEESGKLYNKIKKARKKIVGIRKAIEDSAAKMLKIPQAAPKLPTKKEEVEREWYEKFRWFFSSDDFLVIGGKDATTNEIVVKKHTQPGDAVFHADITGAPFCVVQSEGKKIPQKTLEETAIFAASYSKAWQLGLGTVDVYWINPEQVSKELGLPKGAFMIHGKKNYFRNTTLKLAIGEKDGEIIHGPTSSVSSKTKNLVGISPGNIKSKELAQKIAKKLGPDAKVSEIQCFIPAGKGALA